MANVKTAISLKEDLFKKAESLAKERKISRSQLFSDALKAYIKESENRELLDRMNSAYESPPTPDEKTYLVRMKKYQNRMVEGEW